jgi:hypothetical protein
MLDEEKDIELHPAAIQIRSNGITLVPFLYADKVIFIDAKYLDAFTADDNYRIYIRQFKNTSVALVVGGMFVLGAITEYRLGGNTEELRLIASRLIVAED